MQSASEYVRLPLLACTATQWLLYIVQRGTCTACAVHCGLCVNMIRNPGGEGNDSDIFFMFTALDFSLCQRVICFIEWFVVFF